MMKFLEYGTLLVGPLIWKGDNFGDMWTNIQGRRIMKRYHIDRNFSGVCRATFNLNLVALILARIKRYRKYLHFLDIDAKQKCWQFSLALGEGIFLDALSDAILLF